MERFNREITLTTSEVAELLSVHASTIKRWSADGGLAAERTEGGHRRFHLVDVLEAARSRGVPTYLDGFAPYEAHVWSGLQNIRSKGSFERIQALAMGWLGRARHDRVALLFETLARHPDVPLPLLFDEGISAFMALVGEAWREGRLRVGDEHLVTQSLVEVLARLRPELDRPPSPGAGRTVGRAERLAVVGSTDGNQHHLGALCARLTLEMEGWKTLYLGPSAPAEDFASLQRARGARLVCISFSPPGTGTPVHRTLRVLEALYDPARPYVLALGGTALGEGAPTRLGGPFSGVAAFDGCAPFADALRAGLGRGGAATDLAATGRATA